MPQIKTTVQVISVDKFLGEIFKITNQYISSVYPDFAGTEGKPFFLNLVNAPRVPYCELIITSNNRQLIDHVWSAPCKPGKQEQSRQDDAPNVRTHAHLNGCLPDAIPPSSLEALEGDTS